MASDYGTIGFKETRYAPTKSTQHPKDGSMVHYATGVYDKAGKLVGIKDEECRRRGYCTVSTRAKCNTAGHSSRQRFPVSQLDTDRALDAPYVAPSPLESGEFTPKRAGTRSLRRSVRAMR